MGTAIDGDAATGTGKLVPPRLGARRRRQRIVETRARGYHLADRTGIDQLPRPLHVRPVLRLFRDHEHGVRLRRGREDALAAFEVVGHGLFEADVLAGGERLQGRLFVEVVGQHDVDGVERALRQGFGERREAGRTGLVGHRPDVLRVRVDDGGHVDAGSVSLDAPPMGAGDAAAADEGHAQTVVGHRQPTVSRATAASLSSMPKPGLSVNSMAPFFGRTPSP